MLLNNILNSRNKLKLIRELSLYEEEYCINELAEKTGIHRVRVSNLIDELQKYNIIKFKTKGKVKLISINKENYFVRELIIKLFQKENDLPKKVAKNFVKRVKLPKQIISIILYGSSIKKTFTFKSDIDLMIIYKNKLDEGFIKPFIEEFLKKGILISYDLITLEEFKKLYKQKEASIVTLVKNHIVLYGRRILELI